MPGAPGGSGGLVPLPASGIPINSFKSSNGKSCLGGVRFDEPGNDTFIDSAVEIAADFYDPDQPLWGNDSQSLPALPSIIQSKKETGLLLDRGPSVDHRVGLLDGSIKDKKDKA
ncbi:hypothetical protein R6Q57_005376 [Mikania cordata]